MLHVPVDTTPHHVCSSPPAHGLLHDIEQYINKRLVQGPQGPPGPPGPPGYSQLFGSSTNVTDLVEYIRGKEAAIRQVEMSCTPRGGLL